MAKSRAFTTTWTVRSVGRVTWLVKIYLGSNQNYSKVKLLEKFEKHLGENILIVTFHICGIRKISADPIFFPDGSLKPLNI